MYAHTSYTHTLTHHHTQHTDNKIGDEGAVAIAHALKHNNTFTSLDMRCM